MFLKCIIVQIIFASILLFEHAHTFKLGKAKPVLLVSFDGLRDISFDEFISENPNSNFKKFMDNGVRAEYMKPSFPSATFPSSKFVCKIIFKINFTYFALLI